MSRFLFAGEDREGQYGVHKICTYIHMQTHRQVRHRTWAQDRQVNVSLGIWRQLPMLQPI